MATDVDPVTAHHRGPRPPDESLDVRRNPALRDQWLDPDQLKAEARAKRPSRWSRRAGVAGAWYVRSWPVAAQVIGPAGALAGVYLILGLAASLIIGGVVVFAVGFLKEAKVI